MSVVALWGIILRNQKVKRLVDDSLSEFMDGLTRAPPTKAQSIAALKKLVAQMKKPTFPDEFESSEDYFEFLLGLVSNASFLKERPLVLADFYVSGYYFYFPQPPGIPQVGSTKSKRVIIQTAPNSAYFFYAVPADKVGRAIRDKLDEGFGSSTARMTEPNDWRGALARAAGLRMEDILAVQGIGRSGAALVFVDRQDPSGESDLPVTTTKGTRASIVKQLEDILDLSSF